jgi:ABC-type phosphate transport system substrate-binding protein
LWRLFLPVLIAVFAFAAATPSETSCAVAPPSDDPLVFVVHRSNPLDNLALADLRKIFRGERRKWAHGRNVTVVMRNPGTGERAAVLQTIYGMDENEFARFILHAEFVGDIATPPKQLNSAQGVIRFVFNVPGAIGYVRLSQLDPAVKPLRIDGRSPGDPDYPFVTLPEPVVDVDGVAHAPGR